MAVTIKLYKTTSEKNKLSKTITQVLSSTTAYLNEPTSMTDPVIIVDGDPATIVTANYAYISTFNRYYFINKLVILTSNLVEVSCHVDVLFTYKDEIRNNTALLKRQEDKWNLYVPDAEMKTYNAPSVFTKPFSAGFTGSSYVLNVANAEDGFYKRTFKFNISATEATRVPQGTDGACVHMALELPQSEFAWHYATPYAIGAQADAGVYACSTLQPQLLGDMSVTYHDSPYNATLPIETDSNEDVYVYVWCNNSQVDQYNQTVFFRINNDPNDSSVMVSYNLVNYFDWQHPCIIKLEYEDTRIDLEYRTPL